MTIPIKNNQLCAVCGGELEVTTITHEEKRDNNRYVFQNVPAKVCAACGEVWIDEEVLQQIDQLIESGVPARKVETPVDSIAKIPGYFHPARASCKVWRVW
jgi:YgiT-type zinc finger domain-containing protein